MGGLERVKKVLHCSGAAACNKRDFADSTHCAQLREVVALAYAVLIHHVEDDFPRAPALDFFDPVERAPLSYTRFLFISSVLIDPVFSGLFVMPGVDADHDALHAETLGKT